MTIEALANVDRAMSGVDPTAGEWANQLDTAIDTTLQTLMTMGAVKGVQSIGNRLGAPYQTPEQVAPHETNPDGTVPITETSVDIPAGQLQTADAEAVSVTPEQQAETPDVVTTPAEDGKKDDEDEEPPEPFSSYAQPAEGDAADQGWYTPTGGIEFVDGEEVLAHNPTTNQVVTVAEDGKQSVRDLAPDETYNDTSAQTDNSTDNQAEEAGHSPSQTSHAGDQPSKT